MGYRGLSVAVSFTDKIPSSAIYLVLGTFLSLFASVLGVLLITTTAGAISNIGPTDTNTRYAMEYSDSTIATTINVPVYFPALPTGSKTVQVTDFVRGTSGLGVSFNGGASLTTSGSFTIPAGNFVYDPVSGFWRATINATMTGYGSTTSWDKYVNFRLVLSDASGYIAYGGGRFNAAPNGYPLLDKSVANMYSLYMATPCDITVNTAQTIRFYDLDHENADNGNFSITVRITNTTTGAVVAERNGDSYAMGDGDTLAINMTFEPGHKYRVDIWDVADSNVIQFNFPFDNIAYAVPVCPTPQWSTSGTTTPPPGGVVTTDTPTVTFNHTIRNDLASLDATDKTISAEIFQRVNGGAWASIDTFSRASGLPVGGSFSRSSNITTASNVGNVICQFVRWSPNAWNNSGTEQTPQACVTIATLPRMAIVGGDAASGGGFKTAGVCPATAGGFRGRAGTTPGSFAEYGLLTAPGPITNFWSAGVSGSKALTFANSPGATSGGYAGSRCVANLEPPLTRGVTFANYVAGPGGSLPAAGNWRVAGNLTINASNLTGGKTLIVADPGATVTIAGNLTYNLSGYGSFSAVPSLIIIADNIQVDSGVTQIDGLYIARNNVTTCTTAGLTRAAAQAAAGTHLSATGACRSAALGVNGAVIANGELITARSFGGETSITPPAEVFVFRPEVFLRAYETGLSGEALKTDSETELPPRN